MVSFALTLARSGPRARQLRQLRQVTEKERLFAERASGGLCHEWVRTPKCSNFNAIRAPVRRAFVGRTWYFPVSTMDLSESPTESATIPEPPKGLVGLFSFGPTDRPAPPPGYRYACEDKSLLKDLYYKLFVLPLAAVLPGRVRANDVTFVSQLFALVPAIIGLWCVEGEVPRWVLGVLPPVGYLGYIVFDHLDGTHARKTQTSSPLGELVDHWCDAWNAPLLTFACGLAWNASPLLASSLGFVTGLALSVTYESQRVTGTMKLDAFGSNEALTGMGTSMIVMGVLGRDVAVNVTLPFGVKLAFVLQMVSLVGSAGAIVVGIFRGGPKLLVGVLPYVLGAGLVMGWVGLGLDPRVAPFMMAATSAIVAGRIVIERTTGLRARVDVVGLLLLSTGFLLALVGASKGVQWVAAGVTVVALVARATADFLWATRVLRRFVKKGELLALVVAGEPEEG